MVKSELLTRERLDVHQKEDRCFIFQVRPFLLAESEGSLPAVQISIHAKLAIPELELVRNFVLSVSASAGELPLWRQPKREVSIQVKDVIYRFVAPGIPVSYPEGIHLPVKEEVAVDILELPRLYIKSSLKIELQILPGPGDKLGCQLFKNTILKIIATPELGLQSLRYSPS